MGRRQSRRARAPRVFARKATADQTRLPHSHSITIESQSSSRERTQEIAALGRSPRTQPCAGGSEARSRDRPGSSRNGSGSGYRFGGDSCCERSATLPAQSFGGPAARQRRRAAARLDRRVGPNLQNVRESAMLAQDSGAGFRVESPAELAEVVVRLISDPKDCRARRSAAKQFLAAHRGSAERVAQWICFGLGLSREECKPS